MPDVGVSVIKTTNEGTSSSMDGQISLAGNLLMTTFSSPDASNEKCCSKPFEHAERLGNRRLQKGSATLPLIWFVDMSKISVLYSSVNFNKYNRDGSIEPLKNVKEKAIGPRLIVSNVVKVESQRLYRKAYFWG